MDDPVYEALYRDYLVEIITVFEPSRMTAIYEEMHDLIAPYVAAETANHTYLTADENFDLALGELVQHVQARYEAVQDYLAE